MLDMQKTGQSLSKGTNHYMYMYVPYPLLVMSNERTMTDSSVSKGQTAVCPKVKPYL